MPAAGPRGPISGSATADIKIAADGSMNEASVTMSDTLKTILSAIPTQTLLSAVLGVDASHPAYTVAVTQRNYVWTISALPAPIPGDQNLTQCAAPGAALEISAATIGNYNVTRELVVPTDTAKAPASPPRRPQNKTDAFSSPRFIRTRSSIFWAIPFGRGDRRIARGSTSSTSVRQFLTRR